MVQQTTSEQTLNVEKVLSTEDILQVQALVRGVVAEQGIVEKAVALVRASRPDDDSPDFVRHFLRWGAGPRASQYILLGAKARAILQGRTHVDLEDVRAVAGPVLRHRLVTNFHAESEGVSTDEIVNRLLGNVLK
jgi:MoxR-like ATPase